MNTPAEFVAWFRSVAPYINAFRGKTFVIGFSGEMVTNATFVNFIHDVNLLASLGVRLVLVHGARPQPATFCVHKPYSPDSKPVACDFVFVSDELARRVSAVEVDVATTLSDHQPVVVTLDED